MDEYPISTHRSVLQEPFILQKIPGTDKHYQTLDGHYLVCPLSEGSDLWRVSSWDDEMAPQVFTFLFDAVTWLRRKYSRFYA
jgi:hypothetical protein